MRELKFRAWDEKNKQFADYEDIEECLSCQSRDGWESSDGMGCCFGINAVEVLTDCIIEQYTGLKDKNGKEIYEGDIVKENIFDDYDNEHIIWVVEWRKDECAFKLRYYRNKCLIGDNSLTDDIKKSYEVIGNIHENKELLDE